MDDSSLNSFLTFPTLIEITVQRATANIIIFILLLAAAAVGIEVEQSFFLALRPQFGRKRRRRHSYHVEIAMPLFYNICAQNVWFS